MTQHNAALVEEINSSIEHTELQAGELDAVIDVFALAGPNLTVTTKPLPLPANAVGLHRRTGTR